jgi:flagellar motor protein MotB
LFSEAWLLMGDMYQETESDEEAIMAYRNALRSNPDFFPPVYYILGQLEINTGKYDSAMQRFNAYLAYEEISELEREKCERYLQTCDFAIQAMANPVDFEPVNMGDSINSRHHDYVDAITVDGEKIYFTVNRKLASDMFGNNEDFFYSKRSGGEWENAKNLGPPINTSENEGALFISPDDRYILMAGCNRSNGFGSCDIYISGRRGDVWGAPVNLGSAVNSSSWDSQPCLASDGRTLFFVSNRPGGFGKSDIWKTTFLPSNEWSPPENLGPTINTGEDEMAPFLHPDNQTLYFSSKGHTGMGGYDLYVSRKVDSAAWSEPVNLGYPINTWANEIKLIVNARGDTAYFSSDQLGGFGKKDIYFFPLYDEVRPLLVTYMKGMVYDEKSGDPLEAWFELVDLETAGTVIESMSDEINGTFLICLPTSKSYALNVRKSGYLFYSENFELAGENPITDPFLRYIPLKAIDVGESVILRNIFFDTDQFNLKKASQIELDRLTDLLNENPEMKIEIGGHTDNVGTPEYNQVLSYNRAKAVYDYLLTKGILPERLSYQGYGLSKPVADNKTEAGRKQNRRTEITVTGK